MAATSHSDGTLIFKTQVANIANVVYVCEGFSIKADSRELKNMDENAIVKNRVLIEDPFSASITLQLPSATAPAPPIGSVFTLFRFGANTANVSTATSFTIKSSDENAPAADAERKVTCEVLQTLNP